MELFRYAVLEMIPGGCYFIGPLRYTNYLKTILVLYNVTMKYVMFLRGINVGGIRVPMLALKECLSALGLENVKTYLQTGNVVFDSSFSEKELKVLIEQSLSKSFNYEAFVLLFPRSIVKEVVDNYPFDANDSNHRYALFCSSQEVKRELFSYANIIDNGIEEIAAGKNVIYWRAPKGGSTDTTFSKIIGKSKYKATTTNRNLNTLEKMIKD